MIDAVVFDLFITLTDFEKEKLRPTKLRELAELLDLDFDSFSRAVRASFTQRTTGEMGSFRSSLATIGQSLGADFESGTLDQAVALRMAHQLDVSWPRAGVIEAMTSIKASGRSVGILSDCTPELAELWPQLPYCEVIDAKVFSFEEGQRKPAPELYFKMCQRLGVRPERCLYVGDGGRHELSGATEVGMIAAMLQTPLSRDLSYDAEDNWSGLSINAIEDVLPLLRTLEAQQVE